MMCSNNHKNKVFADYQTELRKIWLQHHTANDCNEDTEVIALVAKVSRPINNEVICSCPNSKPGRIKVDASAHLHDYRIRKKLLSER
jgi:hypothetical protein